MTKLAFIPFGAAGALIGRRIAKQTFAATWALFDSEPKPQSSHREVSLPKLVAAAALEGAITAAALSAADRASRKGFFKLTGKWPGDSSPADEEEA